MSSRVMRGERFDDLVRRSPLAEPFKQQFDGDPRPLDDGLADRHVTVELDVILPAHESILDDVRRTFVCGRFAGSASVRR